MTVTKKGKNAHSGHNFTSGARNAPKINSLLETFFREIKPSEAQHYSSVIIHEALMPERTDYDPEFMIRAVGKVMDQSIFITELYELWQEGKEVCHG